jgi:hypothetical protein
VPLVEGLGGWARTNSPPRIGGCVCGSKRAADRSGGLAVVLLRCAACDPEGVADLLPGGSVFACCLNVQNDACVCPLDSFRFVGDSLNGFCCSQHGALVGVVLETGLNFSLGCHVNSVS